MKLTVDFLKETNPIKVCLKLNKEKRWHWANWLIVRLMNHKQNVQYAIFSAEQVIYIYEKKYPKDKRPRNAIEAAKKWLEDPSEKNKNDAAHAALFALSAVSLSASAVITKEKLRMKILKYGISLLEKK